VTSTLPANRNEGSGRSTTSKPMPSSAPRLVAGSSHGSRPGSVILRRDQNGMHQHRKVGPAQRPTEPVEPGGVVEVAVRADHRLDRVRGQLQPAHVLDHPVRADPGVEQQPVHAAVGQLDLDQGGEAVLADRPVDAEVVLVHGRGQPWPDRQRTAPGRAGVGGQHVDRVVDQRRDVHPAYRP
jgi:hypothetical protein